MTTIMVTAEATIAAEIENPVIDCASVPDQYVILSSSCFASSK